MKQLSSYAASKIKYLLAAVVMVTMLSSHIQAQDTVQAHVPETFTVGIAGTAPFIADTLGQEGISAEIWQVLALQSGWQYKTVSFADVPRALQALEAGKVDVVVGPVSITAERAARARFSQPYYQSSLSILSRTDEPSWWQRIGPFFSKKFFIAIAIFIFILGGVGTLLWIAEREHNPEQFPKDPERGIANGMWCAIVTMSTTGYGDRAPITFWGRIIAGSWMVVSLIFATTMVAGIASTLTLTGLNTTVIATANDLSGKKTAVIAGSPSEEFAKKYGAQIVPIKTLQQGYDLLRKKQADAVVYDRPQLLYFLQQHHDESVSVSTAEYDRQEYGFALPLHTPLLHEVNVSLLQAEESGRVDRIVNAWLGEKK